MSETLAMDLPWWHWAFLVIGVFSFVGVVGALFFPDWPTPDFDQGFEAEPSSDLFVHSAAGFLNVPILRGGTAEILQNGDRFYPAMLEAIRGARDTVNFEVYIFDSDDTGRQFIEAFAERARAGVEVRVLLDWFGSHPAQAGGPPQAEGRRGEAGVLPPVCAQEPGADVPPHPPARDRDRRHRRVHRRRRGLRQVARRRAGRRKSGATA